MTAPALITLAPGGRDQRSIDTITALTEAVACLRPDLRIEPAFVDSGRQSFAEAADRLVAEGHDEIVVVPLTLTEADHSDDTAPLMAEVAARHPGVRIKVAKPLGLEQGIFHALDRRLRETLAAHRVHELDGLVLAGAGSSDPVINASIARAARQWGKRHHLPTVAAFASHAPPAAGEAVRALRADGRRHIAVGMLFLAPGTLSDYVAELAWEAGAVAVAQPLGADRAIAEIILARYSVGAVELVDLDALFADL